MSVEVAVYEDGREVERVDLAKIGHILLTDEAWTVSKQLYPTSGTVQYTVKRAVESVLEEEQR